jgi:hypothetical protein
MDLNAGNDVLKAVQGRGIFRHLGGHHHDAGGFFFPGLAVWSPFDHILDVSFQALLFPYGDVSWRKQPALRNLEGLFGSSFSEGGEKIWQENMLGYNKQM